MAFGEIRLEEIDRRQFGGGADARQGGEREQRSLEGFEIHVVVSPWGYEGSVAQALWRVGRRALVRDALVEVAQHPVLRHLQQAVDLRGVSADGG